MIATLQPRQLGYITDFTPLFYLIFMKFPLNLFNFAPRVLGFSGWGGLEILGGGSSPPKG